MDVTLRPLVVDRLSALVPMPAGVTREGILAGNREMRDAWWSALGLGYCRLVAHLAPEVEP